MVKLGSVVRIWDADSTTVTVYEDSVLTIVFVSIRYYGFPRFPFFA
jgi:hypothetical protein